MKREDVEALLTLAKLAEPVRRECAVPASTLAALCRAWLALEAGAPAIMDTRTELGVCAPTEEDFPALYALQGRHVRIVPSTPEDSAHA